MYIDVHYSEKKKNNCALYILCFIYTTVIWGLCFSVSFRKFTHVNFKHMTLYLSYKHSNY